MVGGKGILPHFFFSSPTGLVFGPELPMLCSPDAEQPVSRRWADCWWEWPSRGFAKLYFSYVYCTSLSSWFSILMSMPSAWTFSAASTYATLPALCPMPMSLGLMVLLGLWALSSWLQVSSLLGPTTPSLRSPYHPAQRCRLVLVRLQMNPAWFVSCLEWKPAVRIQHYGVEHIIVLLTPVFLEPRHPF